MQKIKDTRRKLKFVSAKDENVNNNQQELDSGNQSSEVGVESGVELPIINEGRDCIQQEMSEEQKEVVGSKAENTENKEPNTLVQNKEGRISVDVIPESPFVVDKCIQKALSRKVENAQLNDTGDGTQATPNAPSRKCHRVTLSFVNAKSATLLQEHVDDKEDNCNSQRKILNHLVNYEQEFENEDFASRRLSFPTQFTQEEDKGQRIETQEA